MYTKYIKRALDIFFAALGLAVLSPVFAAVALWIRAESPGPVFFFQKRFGVDNKFFRIIKFRTMRLDTPPDMPTHMLANPGQYITASGRFLRRTSLDELPQLWNVLVGEMSVVGPRPALWNQDDLIQLRYSQGVCALRPGLTGWAQVNGRDEISLEEKARLDARYAREISFMFDMRCVIRTAAAAVLGAGYREGGGQGVSG